MTYPATDDPLAAMLAQAYLNKRAVTVQDRLEPSSLANAYHTQQRILAECGLAAGGWKIGARSPTAPIRGAPLPQPRIYQAGARLAREDFPVLGIELEICYSFGHDFEPRSAPYTEAEVLGSLEWVGAAIEIVSSRIAGWPETAAPLTQLADLQNHGALVLGARQPYHPQMDCLAPPVDLTLDGGPLFQGEGRNPAGDPRRLLCWLVQHCSDHGLALPRGTVITTGSYTGMQFPFGTGTVRGAIAGLPPVEFTLYQAASSPII